jgi:hypothetical protein
VKNSSYFLKLKGFRERKHLGNSGKRVRNGPTGSKHVADLLKTTGVSLERDALLIL